jgi:hypothetical protein
MMGMDNVGNLELYEIIIFTLIQNKYIFVDESELNRLQMGFAIGRLRAVMNV